MRFIAFIVLSVCLHVLLALVVLAPAPARFPVLSSQPIEVEYQVVPAKQKPTPPQKQTHQPSEPTPDNLLELKPDSLVDHSLSSKGKPTEHASPPAPTKRPRVSMEQLLAPTHSAAKEQRFQAIDPYRFDEQDLRTLAEKLSQEPLSEAAGVETSEVINFDAVTQKGRHVSFLWQMKRKIENVWVYPPESIERSEQGAVLIRFSVNQDGSLGGVELIQNPSQSAFLANAAVQAVRDAAPYLPLPGPLEKLIVNGVFVYRLGKYYIYYR